MTLHSRTKLLAPLALAAALAPAAAGCSGLELDVEIDDDGCSLAADRTLITLTAAPATLAPAADSVAVRGTAAIGEGLAIRRVTVDGIDATATSFNFAGWSATLPAAALRPRVANPAVDEKIAVAVTAADACGSPPPEVTAQILVDAP
jgi:hypothetical protein